MAGEMATWRSSVQRSTADECSLTCSSYSITTSSDSSNVSTRERSELAETRS